MVTAAEIRVIAERWKRATRPLRAGEQVYGNRLAAMLGEPPGQEIRRFDDPLEAAVFIVLVRMAMELDQGPE